MLVSLLKLAVVATTKVLKTAVSAKLRLNSVAVVPHDKIKAQEKQVYPYTPAFLYLVPALLRDKIETRRVSILPDGVPDVCYKFLTAPLGSATSCKREGRPIYGRFKSRPC